MIAIVDTGGANLASVRDALERLGCSARLTVDPERIARSPRVILPGVGAAPEAMARLKRKGLAGRLRALKQPVLGICLGMQLFFESSEEGPTSCLGLLPGKVEKLAPEALPVPHMGWNSVTPGRGSETPLLKGVARGSFFYFVHSYRAPAGDWVRASCDYGGSVPSVVQKGNFHGVQFHPERSGAAGARVLANFLAL